MKRHDTDTGDHRKIFDVEQDTNIQTRRSRIQEIVGEDNTSNAPNQKEKFRWTDVSESGERE